MGMFPERSTVAPSPAGWTKRPSWREGEARNVTFIVTEDCQLRCRYCYVVGKHSGARMPLDIAQRSVDFTLADPRLAAAPAVIWDFVGGEPLLEVELIDRICDYAKLRMYILGHPWFDAYRFNISTNGLLYDDPAVQRFIEKNLAHLSIGLSIDGVREKHDAQRVYPDGRGSYDDIVRNIPLWLEQFPDASTKVTIAHDDLPYLAESILHLWDLGIRGVNANVVFDDVWEEGDDGLFEAQLRILADAIIDRDIPPHHTCSLFNPEIGRPLNARDNQNWCGAGKMLAVDAAGNFYPCNRFAAASLQRRKPIILGNCFTGIDDNRLRPFLTLTRTAQSPLQCLDCTVASGCAWCQGDNYDTADSDTIYQRHTAICSMHKARVRANRYFWDRVHGGAVGAGSLSSPRASTLPQWVLPGMTHLVVLLESGATAFCHESPQEAKGPHEWLPLATLARVAGYAAREQLALSVIYGLTPPPKYDELLATIPHLKIVPLANLAAYPEATVVIESADLSSALATLPAEGKQAIIRLAREHLPLLADQLAAASQHFQRLNTVLLEVEQYTADDLRCYEEQLARLTELMVPRYLHGEAGEISCLTDRPALSAMRNCGAGIAHLTVGPDQRLYLCPAFHGRAADSHVGSFEDGPQIANRQLLELGHAPLCGRCDAFHCPRCVYLSEQLTGEPNTPSRQQCVLAHIERAASAVLLEQLHDDDRFGHYSPIPSLDYRDPFELVLRGTKLP
jgi:uncharacterized protein